MNNISGTKNCSIIFGHRFRLFSCGYVSVQWWVNLCFFSIKPKTKCYLNEEEKNEFHREEFDTLVSISVVNESIRVQLFEEYGGLLKRFILRRCCHYSNRRFFAFFVVVQQWDPIPWVIEFSSTMWNSSSGSSICLRNVSRPFLRRKLCSSYISVVTRVYAMGTNIRCRRCSLKVNVFFYQKY